MRTYAYNLTLRFALLTMGVTSRPFHKSKKIIKLIFGSCCHLFKKIKCETQESLGYINSRSSVLAVHVKKLKSLKSVIKDNICHFSLNVINCDMFLLFINTGNVLILRSISSHKYLQSPTNLFLASLAMVDLLSNLSMPVHFVS